MTHEETVKIVRVMCACYPTRRFSQAEIIDMVSAWEMMLEDYSYTEVALALKTIVATDSEGFIPSIGKIIDQIEKLSKRGSNEATDVTTAWNMVMRAISRGIYNADEEFNKMPPLVQKAVGSASMIREMASDANFNFGVEQSQFIKAYQRAVEDANYENKIPKSVKTLLEGNYGNDRIGNSEMLQIVERQGKGNINPC